MEESEALHKAALSLSMMAFGEKNVQTAKHYGNLGRLYQSMQKFQVIAHILTAYTQASCKWEVNKSNQTESK